MISKSLQNKLVIISRNNIHLPDTRSKHFSFLVKRSRIVSFGWNTAWKTHPLAKKFKHKYSGIHSELAVIKNFPLPPEKLKEHTLVNIRLTKNKLVAMSKPCKNCQLMLSFFEVDRIIYSNQNGNFDEMLI